MQLTIEIKDKSMVNKIIQLLEVFKNDGVSIKSVAEDDKNEASEQEFDVEYEKSFQYKLDRAEFEEMKENL